jgi:hypothetical protein
MASSTHPPPNSLSWEHDGRHLSVSIVDSATTLAAGTTFSLFSLPRSIDFRGASDDSFGGAFMARHGAAGANGDLIRPAARLRYSRSWIFSSAASRRLRCRAMDRRSREPEEVKNRAFGAGVGVGCGGVDSSANSAGGRVSNIGLGSQGCALRGKAMGSISSNSRACCDGEGKKSSTLVRMACVLSGGGWRTTDVGDGRRSGGAITAMPRSCS